MRFHVRVAKGVKLPQVRTHSFVFVFAERSGIDPSVTLFFYSPTVSGKNCLGQLQNGDSQPDTVLIAY